MHDESKQPTFDRPFPALTPAQRFHFEVNGYVIIENTLSAAEVAALKSPIYCLRDELTALDDPGADGPRVRGAYLLTTLPHHHFIGHILEAAPALTAYGTHPRMVAMAEEIIGGEGRIVEINAHINSFDKTADSDSEDRYDFHRGIDIPYGCHEKNGLFHCSFVKTLTNLTDLGPDDGGTVVIAGSHKVDVPEHDLLEAAYADPSLIHQVIAPAGSTLLFAESLIHATGRVRSDRERVIVVCGYGTTMFPYWDCGEFTEADIPDHLRTLFKGKAHWTRGPRYRSLGQPADDRAFDLGTWNDRAPAPPDPQ